MDNEPKINLAKIYAWKFLDAHKEFGADEHEKLNILACTTERKFDNPEEIKED